MRPTMEYKVRATKNKTIGGYDLSYGRGKKKLTAGIWFNDLSEEWILRAVKNPETLYPARIIAVHKSDAIEAWGVWAKQNYGAKDEQNDTVETVPPLPAIPTLPKVPSFKRSGPPPSPLRFQKYMSPQRLLEIVEYAATKLESESRDFRKAHVSLSATIPQATEYFRYIVRQSQRQCQRDGFTIDYPRLANWPGSGTG